MGTVKSFIKCLMTFFFALAFIGCAAGPCRGRKPSSENKIKVFKADGSKQCGKSDGTSLEAMAEELNGIEVLSKSKESDGLMHIMLCGSPTGKINVFEVYERDLLKMKALGYKELKK